ncbi:N-acetyl sugar amidotransferase [Amylibacter sp.]|nr:N-acetyl sugar amidotransferase [Amylibacter sp.]MDC0607874.1 N-acetyl sugar amidotransferase [Amylibacter sp.]
MLSERAHFTCRRCVMNSNVEGIRFDGDGICNYCTEFIEQSNTKFVKHSAPQQKLEQLIENISSSTRKSEYSCVMGVSGGVDSTFAVCKAVSLGLRPLLVHLDNGWNSESSQHNIYQLVDKYNLDLITHVINWNETKSLQRSFILADVVDIELLMDNAQAALNYKVAYDYGLKYILAGTNTATEGMPMPNGWTHYKFDYLNIKDINKQHENIRTNTHPFMSTLKWLKYEKINKISWTPFLDYLDYNKNEALTYLEKKIDYKRYRYKHGESIFTRFYQNYILPQKFSVDKRLVHFSTLIANGQMTRQDALNDLEENPYISSGEFLFDQEYVLKKLEITEIEFKNYISRSPVEHSDYKSEFWFFKFLLQLKRLLKI